MVPAPPNFICHFCTRATPNGPTFGYCLYVLCLYDVHVLYRIHGSPTFVRVELVKSPEVTLCKITSIHLYPRRRDVAAQVVEELKAATYATPLIEERRKNPEPSI